MGGFVNMQEVSLAFLLQFYILISMWVVKYFAFVKGVQGRSL